jgi:hypothetical protein
MHFQHHAVPRRVPPDSDPTPARADENETGAKNVAASDKISGYLHAVEQIAEHGDTPAARLAALKELLDRAEGKSVRRREIHPETPC